MSRLLRTLSHALVRRSVIIMPAERRSWAEAMASELEHIASDRDALGFALGALWASAFQSLRSMGVLLALARYGVAAVAGMSAVAGAVFWTLSLPRYEAAGLSPPAMLVCGLLIPYLAVAACALARGGPAPLIRVVWTALALTTAQAGVLTAAAAFKPDAPHRAYFQALVIEDYVALLLLLAVGMALQSAHRWRWLRTWAVYR